MKCSHLISLVISSIIIFFILYNFVIKVVIIRLYLPVLILALGIAAFLCLIKPSLCLKLPLSINFGAINFIIPVYFSFLPYPNKLRLSQIFFFSTAIPILIFSLIEKKSFLKKIKKNFWIFLIYSSGIASFFISLMFRPPDIVFFKEILPFFSAFLSFTLTILFLQKKDIEEILNFLTIMSIIAAGLILLFSFLNINIESIFYPWMRAPILPLLHIKSLFLGFHSRTACAIAMAFLLFFNIYKRKVLYSVLTGFIIVLTGSAGIILCIFLSYFLFFIYKKSRIALFILILTILIAPPAIVLNLDYSPEVPTLNRISSKIRKPLLNFLMAKSIFQVNHGYLIKNLLAIPSFVIKNYYYYIFENKLIKFFPFITKVNMPDSLLARLINLTDALKVIWSEQLLPFGKKFKTTWCKKNVFTKNISRKFYNIILHLYISSGLLAIPVLISILLPVFIIKSSDFLLQFIILLLISSSMDTPFYHINLSILIGLAYGSLIHFNKNTFQNNSCFT